MGNQATASSDGLAKICTGCQRMLSIECYRRAAKGLLGRFAKCRECSDAYLKEYYSRPEVKQSRAVKAAIRYQDPAFREALKKNARQAHRVAQKKRYAEMYRLENKDRIKAYNATYTQRTEVKTRQAETVRRYEERHREPRSQRRKTEIFHSWLRGWNHKRRKIPKWNLHQRMSSAVRRGLINGKMGKRWESLVGYSSMDLLLHLERQFTNGMSWENMGRWHIDHVRPVASFDFSSPIDQGFQDCWALSNLRPLWAAENFKKHAKQIYLI